MYIGIIYPLYVFTFYSRELGKIDTAAPGTKTFPTFRAQKTNKDIATSVRVLLNTLINRLNLDCIFPHQQYLCTETENYCEEMENKHKTLYKQQVHPNQRTLWNVRISQCSWSQNWIISK